MQFTYRPLSTWPGVRTPEHERKSRWQFRASRDDTNRKLAYELERLGVERAVIEIGLSASEIRKDGLPRADARLHAMDPGVIVSFASRHGPLRYACDGYELWEHNLRAIALGLEALRAVDRYGITSKGEQYRGFSALPPGIAMGAVMSKDEAARVLADLAHTTVSKHDLASVQLAYKKAAAEHHPDVGGDADLFRRATEARDVLLGQSTGR